MTFSASQTSCTINFVAIRRWRNRPKKKNCRNCGEICGERVVGKTNAALPELRPIDVRENGGKALVVAI